MKELVAKTELQLDFIGDGHFSLNFWNTLTGEDVICELEGGKLLLQYIHNPEYDKLENPFENEFIEKEISIFEFLELVKNSYFSGLKTLEQ